MVRQNLDVLVIDDEWSIREGCRQILEGNGYSAAIAGDGTEGLRLAERLRPGAALVDLKMPGIGGLDVLERLRRLNPATVPIVITGYGSIDSAVAAMKSGARDYLCKPFDDRRLLAAVESALDGRAGGERSAEREAGGPHAAEIAAVLERAARDSEFFRRLDEEGSLALAGYELSTEEKAAIVSGDVGWIEKRVGRLTAEQKTWLKFRLEQEKW